MQDIIQAISSVGFPIVCCLIMFKQTQTANDNHKQEIEQLKKVIDKNTIQVTKMYEKIDTLLDYINTKGVK